MTLARVAAGVPRAVAGCAAVALVVWGLVADAADSMATSIRRADCRPPPAEVERTFRDKDLGVQECPAPEDWRLLFVASHANSWLEVRRRDALSWSGEDAIVYEKPIGLFPNVSGPLVEWRRDGGRRLHALIFRVVAQDRANAARRVSRLFVVRLGPEKACLIGRVTTNEAARRLADGPLTCSGPR